MSGVVAKEFTVALRREVAARAAVEKEVLEMHAASEELRAWTLQELERLRAYARSTVDELGEELRDARDRASRAEARVAALEASLKDASVGLAEAERSAAASAAESDRRAEAAARAVATRFLGRSLRSSFAQWRASALDASARRRREARSRGVLARAVGRFQTNLARRALDAWRMWFRDCAATRALASRRARRWRHLRRRAGFVAWRDLAVERCASFRFRRWEGRRHRHGGRAGGGVRPAEAPRRARGRVRDDAPKGRRRGAETAAASPRGREVRAQAPRVRVRALAPRGARRRGEARSPGAPRGAVAPRARAGRDGVVARVA
jgi:protein SFI1